MKIKLILRTDRQLTDEEVERISKKEIRFKTQTKTSRYIDRFAGIKGDEDVKYQDYITGWMSKIEQVLNKENKYEYEIIIEGAENVEGLERVHVGGSIGAYKLPKLDRQLKYLKTTELSQLLEESEIIEQIKEKYKEEEIEDYFFSYEFEDKKEDDPLDYILDTFSDTNWIENSQVEFVDENGKKILYNIIRNKELNNPSFINSKKYSLIEFPCNVIFKLDEEHLKFYNYEKNNIDEDVVVAQTKDEMIEKVEMTKKLLDMYGSYIYHECDYKFMLSKDLESEKDINETILDIESTQLDTNNVNVDKLSMYQVLELVGRSGYNNELICGEIFKKLIENYNVEQILHKITEIDDIDFKKVLIDNFSEVANKYDKTEEQNETIKNLLLELLNCKDGWESNASIVGEFAGDIYASSNINEKMEFMKMSIESHNRYCLKKYGDDEFGKKHQNSMCISKLVNPIFSKEEQIELIQRLIKQKDYQAIRLILNECRLNDEEREDVKYSKITPELKNKMANVIINAEDKSFRTGCVYIWQKEESEEVNAFKQLSKDSPFYIIEGEDMRVYHSRKQSNGNLKSIDCFYDYDNCIEGYINIEGAITSVKNGKLHIDVPKKYMGQIIGKQGRNIKEIESILTEKMDSDVKIILHAQKENKTINFEQIEKAIQEQRAASRED